jgi:hypothetical protein
MECCQARHSGQAESLCGAVEYLKGNINELATSSKNKNIRELYRGINEFKWGYQPRSIFVKDENGDLLADSNTILHRWKTYFSQLSNVHDVSDVRHVEIHTAEPLVPAPSHHKVEISIAKLKKYNLQAVIKLRQKCIKQEVKH